MPNPVIELTNISFAYASAEPVLDSINLSVENKQKIALLGRNGTGKTTLFHLLLGLIHPQEGKVTLAGRHCLSETDFASVRSKIGFLFQDSDDQLFCTTVAEDIGFGPFNLGHSRECVAKVVDDTLELVGLPNFHGRITSQLSGGEKRLVALGTVLAMNPDILLLDEPSAGLDEDAEERVISVLNGLDKTMIIASHDRHFLSKTTTTSLTLASGKIS